VSALYESFGQLWITVDRTTYTTNGADGCQLAMWLRVNIHSFESDAVSVAAGRQKLNNTLRAQPQKLGKIVACSHTFLGSLSLWRMRLLSSSVQNLRIYTKTTYWASCELHRFLFAEIGKMTLRKRVFPLWYANLNHCFSSTILKRTRFCPCSQSFKPSTKLTGGS